MRIRRGILAILLVAAVLAAAGFVAVPFFRPRLPHPEVADRDELVRWLVVRDLSAEPAETRRVLVRRLEEEFYTGLDWENLCERLDQSQRKRVWDNIVLLLEPWFMDKTDQYFKLATAERTAYLDRLLDMIAVWRGAELLRPEQTGTAEEPREKGGLLEVLFDQVKQWKERAEPKRREQIDQFLLAVQVRWLLRNLRQPSPTPE